MAGYHELLRDLDGMRYLLRDFTVNGFHTREQYAHAGKRTYDNDRRRTEGLLGDVLRQKNGESGKQLFVYADGAALPANPLHRVYRLCNFTDNDLTLHFFLLDALADGGAYDPNELTERVSDESGVVFEVQTVRRKLNRYAQLGLLKTEKQGKRQTFHLQRGTLRETLTEDSADFLSFFREALPFGCIADELMLRAELENNALRFKHHFLMYTLDDAITLPLLEAIHTQRAVSLTMEPRQLADAPIHLCVQPAAIRVSEMTGRRYLLCYAEDGTRCLRLDMMHNVTMEDALAPGAARALDTIAHTWGVSPGEGMEHLSMTLRIDEKDEDFVLRRLRREGRQGMVTRISEDRFRYDIAVSDVGEMMGWVKSFTGRIVQLESDNASAAERFQEDMWRMAAMYGVTDDDAL